MGFDELPIAGGVLPGVQYWRGIREAMSLNGIEVITASVPASASIEERAEKLYDDVKVKGRGRDVNIIA
jgi:triacylglycerol lipase